MYPIYKCGSEEQKQKYLSKMANLELLGAFALTEPLVGSDASHLKTTAHKVDGGWILNGEKKWIGNGTIADIVIIWATNTSTKKVNGFIVEKNTKGFTTEAIVNKIALRSIQNAHMYLKNCFIPDSQRLPLAVDFQSGPAKCLFLTRIIVSWIALGVAIGAYENCLAYVKNRKQFDVPLANFQISQEKLVTMLSHIQAMFMLSWRVSKLYDEGKLTMGQATMCKAYNSEMGRECVSLAREMQGGNGILYDYGVAKHFVDMEAIYTYEGTYEINTLVTGREITGLPAFKPEIINSK